MAYQMIKAKSISYGGTRALSSIKYIVIHYTGCKGDTAKAECQYFATKNTRTAGAHYFVDQTGAVVQSIGINRAAWSVGGLYTTANGAGSYYNRCTNFNSVSIELCDIYGKAPSAKQIEATRKLVAFIQKKCPNAKTIIRHWDVNGKCCPAGMTGTGNAKWKKLKAKISATSEAKSSTTTTTKKTTTTTTIGSFKVKVSIKDLNIRSKATMNSKSKGHIKPGVYTITQVKKGAGSLKGWGKLKSGAGWISLDYVKRI